MTKRSKTVVRGNVLVAFRGPTHVLEIDEYRLERNGPAVELPQATFRRLKRLPRIRLEVIPAAEADPSPTQEAPDAGDEPTDPGTPDAGDEQAG